MKRIVLGILALPLFSAVSMAQVVTPAPTPAPAAVPAPASRAADAPLIVPALVTPGSDTANKPAVSGGESGKNSFTENQARSRLEANGYSSVSGLIQDPSGIWRGTAMRNGSSVSVGLDFKGNISTN